MKREFARDFFANQIRNQHSVSYTAKGDFLIDGKYIFEIGGKDKTHKQSRILKMPL